VKTSITFGFGVVMVGGAILIFGMVLHILLRVLRAAMGGVGRLFRSGDYRSIQRRIVPAAANVQAVCTNDKCRHPNRSDAVFCAQCGRRL
jgi:hypothetical protein